MIRRQIIFCILTCLACLAIQAQNITRPNIIGPGGVRVNSYTGNMFYQRTDLYLAGRMPLDISFSYNSADRNKDMGFGRGWTFNYGMQIREDSISVTVVRNDGRKDAYRIVSGNVLVPPAGIFDSLTKTGNGTYTLRAKDGTRYFFNDPIHKLLSRQEDRNGNALVFTYNDSLPASITDDAGRSIQFISNSGRISSIIDANGDPTRTVKYEYDNAGYLKKVTDPMGYTLQYDYAVTGPMNTLTDKNGNVVNVVYYDNAAVKEIISCLTHQTINYNPITSTTFLSEVVSGNNQLTSYKFDASGNLVQKSGNCCGFNVLYEYDKDRNISAVTNANGYKTGYTYDNMGSVVSITDALGNRSVYSYEPSFEKLSAYKDRNGNLTTFTYDLKGNVTKVSYPGGIVNSFQYAANGDKISSTDGNGNITTYTHDAYGNLSGIHGPSGLNITLVFDTKSRLLKTIDPLGNTETNQYDALNRKTSVTDAMNNTRKFIYDQNGNLLSAIDKLQNTRGYSYDALDRTITLTDELGNPSHITYDAKNDITSITDPNGNTKTFTYDNLNRLSTETSPIGENTSYGYDPAGNINTINFPNSNTLQLTYDALNRAIKMSDNLGVYKTYTYDNLGNTTSITDGNGSATKFEYDNLNRKTSETDPAGKKIKYTYDNNFNLISITDRNNAKRIFSFDSLNRASILTDPLNNQTHFAYDVAGNLLSIADANGHITSYAYDVLNRHTKITFPNGTTNTISYDAESNLSSFTNANGDEITYRFNAAGLMTEKRLPGNNVYTYEYDKAGKIKNAINADATVQLSYDPAGRVTSESLNGKTTSYTYAPGGGKKTTAYPSGVSITQFFDLHHRLSEVASDSGTLALFEYDKADRLLSKKYPMAGTTTTFTYDIVGRVTSMLVSPGSKLNSIFSYDDNGNRLTENKLHQPNQSEQYQYDADMRLIDFKTGNLSGNNIASPAHHEHYQLDAMGNRQSVVSDNAAVNYAVNTINAYTNVAGSDLQYDNDGNLTNDGKFSYTYDAENKLIQVDGGSTSIYKYDALGRRVQKKANGTVYNSYYADMQQIEDRDTSGNVQGIYVYGSRVDDILYSSVGNSDHFYYKNTLSSVVAITDKNGNMLERYEYAPFGKVSFYDPNYNSITSSTIGNKIYYTGRSYDAEIDKYFFRERQYDQNMGRFQQKDPFGYFAGDFNLYTYAMNMPTRLVDPFGTSSDCHGPSPSSPVETDVADANGALGTVGTVIDDVKQRAIDARQILRDKHKVGAGALSKRIESLEGYGKWAGRAGLFFGVLGTYFSAEKWYDDPTNGHAWDTFIGVAGIAVTTAGLIVTAPAWVTGVAVAAAGLTVYGLADLGMQYAKGQTLGEYLFDSPSNDCQ